MSEKKYVSAGFPETGIGMITLNKPEKRNILNHEVLRDISHAIDDLMNGGARVIIFTGSGGYYSAGYDISRMREELSNRSEYAVGMTTVLQGTIEKVELCDVPTIAMIDGYCIGAAFEFAAACDFRYASSNSLLGITPAKLGFVYPASGISRVRRIVNSAFARELFFTAKLFDADTLAAHNYLNRVVAPNELKKTVMDFARTLSANSPVSINGMKKIFSRISGVYECDSILGDLTEESLKSRDMEEGVKAFYEKRDPVFRGE